MIRILLIPLTLFAATWVSSVVYALNRFYSGVYYKDKDLIERSVDFIRLKDKSDEVIGMVSVKDMDENILVVSENGYGKRSSLEDYRLTNRGGKGVKTISITEKTGKLVTIKSVSDNDDLMIINKSGIAIRMQVEDLRVMGRATQGVKVISLKDGDSIAAVAKVMKDDDDIEDIK